MNEELLKGFSISEEGNSFYFKVNDVPIFAKGSNIIPINLLPEKGQNETTIRYLLESAKDVHMNMLRVWGGGVYESDAFYNVADELGIIIWQDFMFACAMYPTSDDFIRYIHMLESIYSHLGEQSYLGSENCIDILVCFRFVNIFIPN